MDSFDALGWSASERLSFGRGVRAGNQVNETRNGLWGKTTHSDKGHRSLESENHTTHEGIKLSGESLILSSDRFGLLCVLGFNFVESLFEALDVKKQSGRVHDYGMITISKISHQRNKKIDSYVGPCVPLGERQLV